MEIVLIGCLTNTLVFVFGTVIHKLNVVVYLVSSSCCCFSLFLLLFFVVVVVHGSSVVVPRLDFLISPKIINIICF